MAQLIKVRFLKNDLPQGNAYTYYSNDSVEVGELVQVNASAKGVVTEIDVPEETIKDFADKVKFIQGKVIEGE